MNTDAFTASLPEYFGHDETPGIVAVERAGERAARIYRRNSDGLTFEEAEIYPWVIVTAEASTTIRNAEAIELLNGSGPLGVRCVLSSWSQWRDVTRNLKDAGQPVVTFRSLADQYLLVSGRGLFRGMEFEHLIRAQVDIETLSLDPHTPQAEIVLVSVALNGTNAVAFRADELGEAGIIEALGEWLHQHDPDVIEGHNLFNFDIPYLVERARHHGIRLTWGRDGSPLWLGAEQRFKAGARSIPYQSAYVYGRHVIDTYQQIQRYDATGQLESYALKPVIAALGLTRSERTFVAGRDIAGSWTHDRERLIRYALDDVLDVNTLSELALPTEFYQTRVLPRGLQATATGGPGEKVNDLLLRYYVSAHHSLPMPSSPHDYPGGYAEIRRVGLYSPVVKTDVESLYPSIMVADNIGPASDTLGVFVPMLGILTAQRLHAKREEQRTEGNLRAQWRGIQTSFKVLINSFYGYLGYSRGWFNDFSAAERVTLRGRQLIQDIVENLEQRGAVTIEIDTDGVFFQPPDHAGSLADEIALIDEINTTLPDGIRLAHDGRYRGMLSLKLKNYALLTYDGGVILKGSSLRSRREEPFLRLFLNDAVVRLLDPGQYGSIREYYLALGDRILRGELSVDELARTETITEQTYTSAATRRLAEAAQGERIGERIRVYQREDGSLARADAYVGDEDRDYLLRRLHDMAERFRPIYDSAAAFDYEFPMLSSRTNIEQLRKSLPATQLSLFNT